MNFIKCLAKLMAEYRKYWESENHKAALERKMQQDSFERTIMLEQYNDCANIMKEAINNCADYLGIQPVKDISAICTVNPVSRTTEGLLYFNMRARRRAGITVGGHALDNAELDVDILWDKFTSVVAR